MPTNKLFTETEYLKTFLSIEKVENPGRRYGSNQKSRFSSRRIIWPKTIRTETTKPRSITVKVEQ